MNDFSMTIDGENAASVDSFGVINPARGEVFAEAPSCSREQLDEAMEAAGRAYPRWRADESQRRTALAAIADAIGRHADELARTLTMEQGKPLADARGEVEAAAAWIRYTTTLEIPVEVVQDDARARVEIRRRPIGVVAAITPWNFPLLLAVWKLAPALLAGNTVVLKPSPYTPLTSLALGRIARDALPPGVFNVVSGGDELGAWMTSHPVVKKISFTGSVATGKKVASAAASDLKRVTLELGGNDAAVVLDDVVPEKVAEQIFWNALANCGQVCSAVKRVYVPERILEPVSKRMAELARDARVGDGMEQGTKIGPLNNRPQFERVAELVEDARRAGGKILAGGEPLGGKGYFFRPTVVTDVAEGVRLVDEEQFGPAVPVMGYASLEEAIERANGTSYGLSGSVWGADVDRAAEVAAQLECGTAWVNKHIDILPHLPFGGVKQSGIGVENGPWGLLGFTEIQTVNVGRG